MSGQLNRQQVLQALGSVNDPELDRDLVSLGMIKDVVVQDGRVEVSVELTTPACPMKSRIAADVERAVRALPGVTDVQVHLGARVQGPPRPQAVLPQVKHIIAVGAGKGGVGKSTVAVMLAMSLRRSGARVGLLDADVFGPSIPTMLGVPNDKPLARDGKILPVEVAALSVMSMGFLLDPDDAVVWRGPMVHGVVKQFLSNVDWGELDYLIVDLPPGTGDVPLTLSQSIPMTGAVVVCTGQQVARLDAGRAIQMYEKLGVHCLGVVENMTYFVALDTGKEYDLFGKGGAAALAEQYGVPFLGSIPLNVGIRRACDAGTPDAMLNDLDLATRDAIEAVAGNLAARVCAATNTAAGSGAADDRVEAV
ncbi:MAG TPA: Mrp/NBP35 family ATP-binding protein [Phycisphaerae bacterium]|nr:Mrp/NBP35 family ATP-binding protein [Phycisphaerae bacterium]